MKKLFSLKKCCSVMLSLALVVTGCLFYGDTTPTDATSTSTSRTYRKYTRSTHSTTSYTLTQSEILSLQSRSIIGTDDRIPSDDANYMTGCAAIFSYMGLDSNGKPIWSPGGNAFLVGENLFATVAHKMANNDSGYIFTGDGSQQNTYSDDRPYKIVLYNADGTEYGRYDIDTVHVPDRYFTDTDCSVFDYALFTISDTGIDWDDFYYYNLGTPLDNIANTNVSLKSVGFSRQGNVEHDLYVGDGFLTNINDTKLFYNCDTLDGQSGCPIVWTRNYNGDRYDTVLAIHAFSGNSGIRITSPILQFFYNNPNI